MTSEVGIGVDRTPGVVPEPTPTPPLVPRPGRTVAITALALSLVVAMLVVVGLTTGTLKFTTPNDAPLTPPGLVKVEIGAFSTGPAGEIRVEYADGAMTIDDSLDSGSRYTFSTAVPKGGTVAITLTAYSSGGKEKKDQQIGCDISRLIAVDAGTNGSAERVEDNPVVQHSHYGKGSVTCTWTNP